jgi:biotin transport system substrate-specific component
VARKGPSRAPDESPASVGIGLGHALVLGLAPFLVGDAVKILLASLLLPAAWRLVQS